MSYSALSHGGVARMSTLVVDSDLDMAGFDLTGIGTLMADKTKTGSINEAVIDASVKYDDTLYADVFLPVASGRVRAYDNTETTTNGVTPILVFTQIIPAHYGSGTVRVGGDVVLDTTFYAQKITLKVCVNDAQPGVWLQSGSVAGAPYITVSDDTIAVVGGDIITITLVGTVYASGRCKNLFVACDDTDIPPAAKRNAVW